MQRPSEQKRRTIADSAAPLFAGRPFHEVRLDDVAAAARVGKGTLYVYFKSKEDLYASLLFDAFVDLIDRLRRAQGDAPDLPASPEEELAEMVRGLVAYAFERPFIFELSRFVNSAATRRKLAKKRAEVFALIQATIQRGNDRGCWRDARPEMTAVMIPGLVRSAMLYGPKDVEETALATHIVELLTQSMKPSSRRRIPITNARRLVTGGIR